MTDNVPNTPQNSKNNNNEKIIKKIIKSINVHPNKNNFIQILTLIAETIDGIINDTGLYIRKKS